MQNHLRLGSWNLICDICGQKKKAEDIKRRWDNYLVCKDDWERRHPSDFLRVSKEKGYVPFSFREPNDVFVPPVCSIEESKPLADQASADCARISFNGTTDPVYDPYYDNVVLQLSFDNKNNDGLWYDTSRYHHVVTMRGQNFVDGSTSASSNSSSGWSGNLSTFSFARIPYNPCFNLGSGDFTVEYWVKTGQGFQSGGELVNISRDWTGVAGDWFVAYAGRSLGPVVKIADYSVGTGVYPIGTGAQINNNQWRHIAWTKLGTTHTMWIDGVNVSQLVWAGTIADNTKDLLVGAQNAWIDNVRITKGVCRYTSRFTPNPNFTSPEDFIQEPPFSTVALLLKGEGVEGGTTFTDESILSRAMTRVGLTTTTKTERKFGEGSIKFVSASSCGLSTPIVSGRDPIAGTATGTNSYFSTFEFWIKTSQKTVTSLFSQGVWPNTGSWIFRMHSTSLNDIQIFHPSFSVSTAMLTYNNVFISDNQWHHVALVKEQLSYSLYVDGLLKGTIFISGFGSVLETVTGNLQIGFDPFSGFYFNGFMDEIRITQTDYQTTKTVGAARYRGLSFTPPTSTFPTS